MKNNVMWMSLAGVVLIVVGFVLAYLGWRAMSASDEIESQEEWEDAVYGPQGQSGVFLIFGALVILGGLLLVLRLF